MGMNVKCRPWLVLSSSSGETFARIFKTLAPETQSMCQGLIADREAPVLEKAREILGSAKVHLFKRPDCESKTLDWIRSHQFSSNGIIYLCGFFGILKKEFIENSGVPILNTHPSLLPSFAGLEKKVHEEAAEKVPLSGFTLHLVTEELDGGPILYQHPVFLDPRKTNEELRADVRSAEQKQSPAVLEKLFRSKLAASDRLKKSKTLRFELGLVENTFTAKEYS